MPSALIGDDFNSLNRFVLILGLGLFGVGICLAGLAWCINAIIDHPSWFVIICLLLYLVENAFNTVRNLTSSPLSSGEPLPEPSPARAPDLFVYGVHKCKTPSEPSPQARRYTAPEPSPTPSRYDRSPFGLSNPRNGQPGMSSRWTPSSSGTSSARSSRGPLTPSPGSVFPQPRVFVEPRRQTDYSWFNALRPASPICPPMSKPDPSYDAFAAPATTQPGPFTSHQQLRSEPPTLANHHLVGLGEQVPFSSPPLASTPTRCPVSGLWAPRSPKEVDGLGPNVPSQRTLPPAPISSYMHRPRVSIAEAIRLRMDFEDLRISPVPAEDEDYDMRGPGMGDMDVDRVLIMQDVEMSPAVAFEEDVVMEY